MFKYMCLFIIMHMVAVIYGKEILPGYSDNDVLLPNQDLRREKVKFDFYYETGCPYSIKTYTEELESVVKELAPYIDMHTNPIGNVRLVMNGTNLKIKCQHGDVECSGNALHACAIDALKDPSRYVPFNSCMMKQNTNEICNDKDADACGEELNVDAQSIKECAKGIRGFELLLHYGIERTQLTFRGVPWWFINGVSLDEDDTRPLKQAICDAFKNPPQVCTI